MLGISSAGFWFICCAGNKSPRKILRFKHFYWLLSLGHAFFKTNVYFLSYLFWLQYAMCELLSITARMHLWLQECKWDPISDFKNAWESYYLWLQECMWKLLALTAGMHVTVTSSDYRNACESYYSSSDYRNACGSYYSSSDYRNACDSYYSSSDYRNPWISLML